MVKIVQNKQTDSKKTSLPEIENFYKGNCEQLIGLEYERLSLNKKTLKNADYEKLENYKEKLMEGKED